MSLTLSISFPNTTELLRATTLLAQLESEHPSTTHAQEEQVCGEQQPEPEPIYTLARPPAEVTPASTQLNRVLQALDDPRFTYRTASVLMECAGVYSMRELEALLEDNGIEYTTLRRRSDGALLIALDNRV